MEELEKNETSTQAEENTVSLASAQALADALAKIEAYTPTTWVDNSSPDIDAEHLNKPEQAIKRVTDALNSAVDVIKDLQSQVTKNAGDISTVNNNLSKCLQYIHSETDVFDFNDPKTPAGYHRLGAAASYKNAPSGLDEVNFCTVEVVRPTISDTLAMTIYPYKKGINPPVWYKSGGSNEWSTLPWNVYATKSDLLNFKTFQISIKTNTVKDGESQMYHGNVKISDDKNCPPNTVCIIPYGARLETDASRAGIISYRATDTFCAVSHPTISNKNFIVTVLAIYKS